MPHRNLIGNPRPRGPAGWTTGGANMPFDAFTPPGVGQEGAIYAKATATAANAAAIVVSTPFTAIPVTPGNYYSALIDSLTVLQRPVAPGLFLVLVAWLTTAGALVSQSLSPDLPVGVYVGADTRILAPAPPTALYASLRVGATSAPSGSVVEFQSGRFQFEPLDTVAS